MTPKLLNILLLVLSVVLYHFVASPLYSGADSGLWTPGENNVQALIAKKAAYDATLLEAGRVIAKAKIMKKQYDDYTDDTKKKMAVMVPDSVDSLVFLDEITRITNDAGPVMFLGVKDKQTGEYSLTFSVMATYTQFKQIMTYWERSMRLFNLQSVSFSPGKKDEDVIKFNVEFSTYYLDIKPQR